MDFDGSAQLEKVFKELESTRAAVKVALGYTTGSAPTRRRTTLEFFGKLNVLKTEYPEVFNRFPVAVKTHFNDILISKPLESKQWSEMAKVMETGTEGLNRAELFERMIGIFMKDMEELEGDAFKSAGLQLMNALQEVAASSPDDVKKDMLAIAAVAGCKPFAGSTTLEEPLAVVMATPTQPGFRVLHSSRAGEALIKMAATCQKQLVARLDAESSLTECSEFFKGFFSRDAVSYFLEHGEDKPTEKLEVAADGQDSAPDAEGARENCPSESTNDFAHLMKTFAEKVSVMVSLCNEAFLSNSFFRSLL